VLARPVVGTFSGVMNTQLLAEPVVKRLTVAELEKRLATFQRAYGLTTEEFLARYNNPSDPLNDIEDMEPWFESHAMLERLRAEGEAAEWQAARPEITSEGSKEPSLLFIWTSQNMPTTRQF